MKVPYIYGVNDLRLDEIEIPHPGPDDVVLAVAAVGICGSDLAAVARGTIYGDVSTPSPLGHELSGVVVEVGSQVRSFRVGEKVIVNPLINAIGTGGPEGGFGERILIRDVVTHPESLVRIPDSLPLERAALVEPLAVALHGINRVAAQAGETAAVFGAGPIGLAVVLSLRQRGITDIVVFDLSPLRRESALQLGAKIAMDPRDKPPAEVLAAAHGTESLWGQQVPATDLFIEASGAPGVIENIISFCGNSKRIAIVGAPKHPAPVDFTLVMAKEITLSGALGYPQELPEAIDILTSGEINIAPFVSHRFAADDILAAFAIASDPNKATKVLVCYPIAEHQENLHA